MFKGILSSYKTLETPILFQVMLRFIACKVAAKGKFKTVGFILYFNVCNYFECHRPEAFRHLFNRACKLVQMVRPLTYSKENKTLINATNTPVVRFLAIAAFDRAHQWPHQFTQNVLTEGKDYSFILNGRVNKKNLSVVYTFSSHTFYTCTHLAKTSHSHSHSFCHLCSHTHTSTNPIQQFTPILGSN